MNISIATLEKTCASSLVHLSPDRLNIEDKTRSNIFTWRGQFSPQLIEELLIAYCPRKATILDPFVGSGTVLYEAAKLGYRAFGFEVNPSAWILSRIFELANLPSEKRTEVLNFAISLVCEKIPLPGFFSQSIEVFGEELIRQRLSCIRAAATEQYSIAVIDALVILLDFFHHALSIERVHLMTRKLEGVIRELPFTSAPISSQLADARALPLADGSIDFVVTSPPYINVFNYHQNVIVQTPATGSGGRGSPARRSVIAATR